MGGTLRYVACSCMLGVLFVFCLFNVCLLIIVFVCCLSVLCMFLSCFPWKKQTKPNPAHIKQTNKNSKQRALGAGAVFSLCFRIYLLMLCVCVFVFFLLFVFAPNPIYVFLCYLLFVLIWFTCVICFFTYLRVCMMLSFS